MRQRPGRTCSRSLPSDSNRAGRRLESRRGTKPSGKALPNSISRWAPATSKSIWVTNCSGISSMTLRKTCSSRRSFRPPRSRLPASRSRSQSWPFSVRSGKATSLPLIVSFTRPVSGGIVSVSGSRSHRNSPRIRCLPDASRILGLPRCLVTTAGVLFTVTCCGHRFILPGSVIQLSPYTCHTCENRPVVFFRFNSNCVGQAHRRCFASL